MYTNDAVEVQRELHRKEIGHETVGSEKLPRDIVSRERNIVPL
jgi:hypothetical protein